MRVGSRVVWSAPARSAQDSINIRWVVATGLMVIGAAISLALIIAGTVQAVFGVDMLTAVPPGVFAGTIFAEYVVLVRRLEVLPAGRLANTVLLMLVWCSIQLVVGSAVWIGYVVRADQPDSIVVARIALTIGAGIVGSIISGLLASGSVPEAGPVPHGVQRGTVDGDHLL